jgi:hypothetical protein
MECSPDCSKLLWDWEFYTISIAKSVPGNEQAFIGLSAHFAGAGSTFSLLVGAGECNAAVDPTAVWV